MKNILTIGLFCFISLYAFSQQQSITPEERAELLDIVVPTLRTCIANFSGTYEPGTTIKSINPISDTKFEINGTVSYRAQQCGLVSNTQYSITIYQEGSQFFITSCIYSRYCLYGVIISEDWDCECKKNQYNTSNAAEGTINIMMLLQKLSN